MSDNSCAINAQDIPAVLVIPGQGRDVAGIRCMVYSMCGTFEAWTWLEVARRCADRSHVGVATILPVDAGGPENLLVGFTPDQSKRLSEVLPRDICPIPGLLGQVAYMIDSLTIEPLRSFARRALLKKEVVSGYWQSPASRQHHHAFPGGLAKHSAEVAVAVSTARGLPSLEQELGIVYALIHDYGKIWWMNPELRPACGTRNHEAMGLDMLRGDLDFLAVEDAEIAAIMTELLGGPAIQRASRYPLAIRKIVQAFDQLSCEKTRGLFPESRKTYEWDVPF
jgi:hypothetical protein